MVTLLVIHSVPSALCPSSGWCLSSDGQESSGGLKTLPVLAVHT